MTVAIRVKMDAKPNYTFVFLEEQYSAELNSKSIQKYLTKWGINENLSVQHFSFNEPFQVYHKYHLAQAFFKDPMVAKELLTKRGNSWEKTGIVASSVEIKQVPCSILSMSFFEKLEDPKNRVIYKSGGICKRYDVDIDGFYVPDNLRGMLLDEECDEFNLYSEDDRQEFIFRIFQFLILGGSLCQYEDILEPYLDVTKRIYKDLVSVRRKQYSDELSIGTLVLEVVAKDFNDEAYFPRDPLNRQSLGFLLINSVARQVTSFLHQFR